MSKRSAGILLFRRTSGPVEVLIAHMGGPLWARKDEAAWSIPKGEYLPDEPAEQAAEREFTEELGLPVPAGERIALGEVTQRGGKSVTAWAIEADLDPAAVTPGTFQLEWPPRSGRLQDFPEVDRVGWFTIEDARPRLVSAQREFLDRLADAVG